MSNKAIKLKAEEHLSYGLPKQHAYGLLMAEFPEAKPKKVAEVLRYMPTLQARERFRSLHFALLGIILASAALRVLPPILQGTIRMDQATSYLSLVPIATLLVGYSIYRWQGQVFEWVGWVNVLGVAGVLKGIPAFLNGGGNLEDTSQSMLSFTIGALMLYLTYKVFAKPKVEQDPMGQGTKRYVFAEEGMV
ncbi:MAG: hypothetical protein WEC15_07130 [Flavobacteriales bacterium]